MLYSVDAMYRGAVRFLETIYDEGPQFDEGFLAFLGSMNINRSDGVSMDPGMLPHWKEGFSAPEVSIAEAYDVLVKFIQAYITFSDGPFMYDLVNRMVGPEKNTLRDEFGADVRQVLGPQPGG